MSCGYLFGYGQQDTMDQALSEFLKDEVDLSSTERAQRHSTMVDLSLLIREALTNENVHGVEISKVRPAGLSWDAKMTSRVSEYHLMVICRLGSLDEQWSCIKKERTNSVKLDVRRISPDLQDITEEYKDKMAAYANKLYLYEVHYDEICPLKFTQQWKRYIVETLGQLEFRYELELGDSEDLTQPYCSLKCNDWVLKILPVLEVVKGQRRVNPGWIWSSSVTQEVTTMVVPKGTRWERWYGDEEDLWKVTFDKNKSSGVLTQVYRILSAITSTSTPLGQLNKEVVENFLMYLAKKFAFHYHKLTFKEAFKMVLVQLEECLRSRSLPHHFEPETNVLSYLQPEVTHFLSRYLKSVKEPEDYVEFLLDAKVRVPRQVDVDLILLEQAKEDFLAKGTEEKVIKLKEQVARLEHIFKTLLETYFNRADITKRVSLDRHRIFTQFLKNGVKMLVSFQVDGQVWLPKREDDLELLEADFQPYHLTWAKYNEEFRHSNQALKYGYEETYFQMDSCKFTSTVNGEIMSAVNNYRFEEDLTVTSTIRPDKVVVKVKLELLGQTVTLDMVPSVAFTGNEHIADHFSLVSADVVGKRYWKRIYDYEISSLLGTVDAIDHGCRLEVLSMLDVVLALTPLARLDDDVLVAAVLNNKYHYGWSAGSHRVAKMTKYLLDYLVECLDHGLLPHPVEGVRNLLRAYPEELLDLCAEYLRNFKANSFKPSSYHLLLYRNDAT